MRRQVKVALAKAKRQQDQIDALIKLGYRRDMAGVTIWRWFRRYMRARNRRRGLNGKSKRRSRAVYRHDEFMKSMDEVMR